MLQASLAALDPQLAEWADGFIFDEVWGREGLGEEERMLVAVTALAATARHNQLRVYLHGALQRGIPAAKIHEALVMLVVYVGFPAALDALIEWRAVLASHERRTSTT